MKIGIDAPFGWPVLFVQALSSYTEAGEWPESVDGRRRLRLRSTDIATIDETGGPPPLSVSSDRIAVCAMRCAELLGRLAGTESVDRTGAGTVAEVYPAAAQSVLAVHYRGAGLERSRPPSPLSCIIKSVSLSPSPRTRQLFREFLVGTVLRYIDDVFTAAGIKQGVVPPEQLPGGQRRSLVEEYYAGVDWRSARDVGKVLRVYEHILFEAPEGPEKQKLVKTLRLDGFAVDQAGRISPPVSLDLGIDRDSLEDPGALEGYERRILENINEDPELAIGSGKELVEAVCKLLLDDAGIEPDTGWTAEQLFKQALKTLDLSVDEVPDSKAGAESIKKVLRGMHQAVIGTAELRNRFGTGHGRHRRSGLGPRHARLVAAAALALARFLLDTRAEKHARDADKAGSAA